MVVCPGLLELVSRGVAVDPSILESLAFVSKKKASAHSTPGMIY